MKYPTSSIRYQVFDIKDKILKIRYQVPGIKYLLSYIMYQVLDIEPLIKFIDINYHITKSKNVSQSLTK